MSEPSPLETIFLPFEQEFLPWPEDALFLGAQYYSALKDLQSVHLWQTFKPYTDSLKRDGLSPTHEIPEQKFDMVLCLVPKQLEEAKYWMSMALERLNDRGVLILSAANDAFGARLKKWMEEAGLQSIQSESKNKAKVVWGTKGSINQALVQEWLAGGKAFQKDFSDNIMLETQPGIFSWDRIDPASKLLVENFPVSLSGHVADFGCGYGYLSLMAFKNHPRVQKITLIEADKRALDCAEKNLSQYTISPLWHDAKKALPASLIFDHVIMNPPFHTGKKTDTALGQSFITNAAQNLKKNGMLSLVANNHLPYEALLEKLFSSFQIVVQKNGYKIIRAIK